MGEKCKRVFETETMHLSECPSGFWLYDETRGMNLGMRAATEREAFVEAIQYYQRRLKEVESSYASLYGRVTTFVDSFTDDKE